VKTIWIKVGGLATLPVLAFLATASLPFGSYGSDPLLEPKSNAHVEIQMESGPSNGSQSVTAKLAAMKSGIQTDSIWQHSFDVSDTQVKQSLLEEGPSPDRPVLQRVAMLAPADELPLVLIADKREQAGAQKVEKADKRQETDIAKYTLKSKTKRRKLTKKRAYWAVGVFR